MKVYELAMKMMAEAQTMLPPNTANPFFWSIGNEVRRAIFLESIIVDQMVNADSIQKHMQFCGLPVLVIEKDPNSIRLMMAMQVKAERLSDADPER